MNKILSGFIAWRLKHINQRQFVYILSFVIGLVSSLAAVLLKNSVHYTHEFLTHHLSVEKINVFYLAYPLIGIFLTILFIRFFVKDDIGHGISRILYAISKKNSNIKAHNSYSSLIASTLTVGFGGSVGLEAPIILTGSAIGSNLGRIFRLNYKTMTILIGCGAAGALAGIFKAPVAAVIFGLEVLMLDLTMWSLVPLLISAVTGASISYLLLGRGVIFTFAMKDPFLFRNIPFYILLGIITGLISVYFTRGTIRIESLFGRIKNPYIKLVIGGTLLGILILFFPPLFGEGYDTLNILLDGNASDLANGSLFYQFRDQFWLFFLFLALILVFKVIAMSATTGSGGVGGIFAPTLFMGGVAGFLISRVLDLFHFIHVSERNFALLGMAGMMAGVMHAPLTAIFLIAEITGGYALFLPLIITATISYITIKYFEPHSLYASRLAERGELITHHKDKAVLTLLEMEKVIETDFNAVSPEYTLGELVKVISKSKRNIFPVLNKDGMLVGIVLLDSIRHIIFNADMYTTVHVRDLMHLPPAFVSPKESMESALQKFEENNAWNLPVIDNGKYVGFISKSKIFSVYRKWLVDISEE
ncbi:MAG TPA: chloride channel protein [Bacteroidales bacterium]|nr:chloride channel protein [Bacteroidales bacterium]